MAQRPPVREANYVRFKYWDDRKGTLTAVFDVHRLSKMHSCITPEANVNLTAMEMLIPVTEFRKRAEVLENRRIDNYETCIAGAALTNLTMMHKLNAFERYDL